MNRRDTLRFLGLTGAGSVALSTESMVSARGEIAAGNDFSRDKAADALWRLAEGIKCGLVVVRELSVSSSLRPNELVTQRLVLEFDIPEMLESS